MSDKRVLLVAGSALLGALFTLVVRSIEPSPELAPTFTIDPTADTGWFCRGDVAVLVVDGVERLALSCDDNVGGVRDLVVDGVKRPPAPITCCPPKGTP